jgi:2-polyprenyl-6-methoxyphenol hydroxylase-like FAD-dependent oxidoreductase
MKKETVDVLIVGAGPAGSVAAGLLRKRGIGVLVIEKETFPRFSIGESLLPQSMAYIEEAGMLQAVVEAGFQYKNGAAFARGDRYTDFDFARSSRRDGAPPIRCSAPISTTC